MIIRFVPPLCVVVLLVVLVVPKDSLAVQLIETNWDLTLQQIKERYDKKPIRESDLGVEFETNIIGIDVRKKFVFLDGKLDLVFTIFLSELTLSDEEELMRQVQNKFKSTTYNKSLGENPYSHTWVAPELLIKLNIFKSRHATLVVTKNACNEFSVLGWFPLLTDHVTAVAAASSQKSASGFRGAKWGGLRSDIGKYELSKPIKESSEMVWYAVEHNGIEMEAGYVFEKGRLVRGIYQYSLELESPMHYMNVYLKSLTELAKKWKPLIMPGQYKVMNPCLSLEDGFKAYADTNGQTNMTMTFSNSNEDTIVIALLASDSNGGMGVYEIYAPSE